METQRKLVVLTRHGVKQNGKGRGNLLRPTSIQRLHDVGRSLGKYISQEIINPDNTLIRHSDELRTLKTAKAILNGLYNEKVHSLSNRQLDMLQRLCYDVEQDDGLSYGADFKYNKNAFNEQGEGYYTAQWMADPDSTTYEGVEVTSFNEVLKSSETCLANNLAFLISGEHDKRLGILATHNGVIECIAVAAINSGRSSPILRLEDIGGHFPMEGNALIEIDHNPKSGIYTAKLRRDDQTYDMSLNQLIV